MELRPYNLHDLTQWLAGLLQKSDQPGLNMALTWLPERLDTTTPSTSMTTMNRTTQEGTLRLMNKNSSL